MPKVYIGLGSNLGDRKKNIDAAIKKINVFCSDLKCSSVIETKPVGFLEQPLFLNAVIKGKTALSAKELLSKLQQIEKELGKNIEFKDGPRTIDLDILLYGDAVINTEELVIPHPEMHRRRFVLEPLAELDPDLVIPGHDKTVAELLHLLE